LAAVFSGAARSVASAGIKDEDGALCAGDLDRLAGGGTLVEQVEARLRIVVWNPFADGLPGRFDGLEGLDVEGRGGWRRKVEDALPKSVESEEELDFSRTASDRVPLRLPMTNSFAWWIHRAAQWRLCGKNTGLFPSP
jgi:hypothetical protein